MTKTKEEAVVVRDADANIIHWGETAGECKEWCQANNITGENGEYIAFGTFDNGYFDIEDYTEI